MPYPEMRDREVVVKQIARDVEVKLWNTIKSEMIEEDWYKIPGDKRLEIATSFIMQESEKHFIELNPTEFDYVMTKLVL